MRSPRSVWIFAASAAVAMASADAEEVAIRNGRVAQVGDAGPLWPCARVIDLGDRVPEDRIPKIRSVLTLQGGRVVHAN